MAEMTTPKSTLFVAEKVNKNIRPKILNDNNFEVISIKPELNAGDNFNTSVTIRVNLGSGDPLPTTEQFATRVVRVRRIDLKDIAEFRKLPKDEAGNYYISGADSESIALTLDCNILENEMIITPVGDRYRVTAAPTSLGYIGGITFIVGDAAIEEGGDDTEEPEVIAPANLTVNELNGGE